MAAAEKGGSDKKPETCQEALGDTSKMLVKLKIQVWVFQYFGVLAVCGFSLAGFFL